MTTETKSSEPTNEASRELVLQRPLTKGSRGRNGAFTATVVTLYAYNGREGGALPFLAIEGASRRQGRQAPLQLGLSLEDAMLLAEEIVQAVRAVLPASCPDCTTPLDHTTVDAHGGPNYCPQCDRETARA